MYVFDALSVGVARNIPRVRDLNDEALKELLLKVKTSEAFVANTGAGANTRPRLLARLTAAVSIIGGE